MKIVLFNIKSNRIECVNKDLSGGMGTATSIGNGWRAKLLEWAKKQSVVLPVISLAYCAAVLKSQGCEVEVINTNGKDKVETDGDIFLFLSSIVDCKNEKQIASRYRKKGRPLGFYGAFASAVPKYFENVADFVIIGEPENALHKIAKGKIKPQGRIKSEPVENLDKLPFPAWEFFDINKFSYTPSLNVKPIVSMLSSRGCPYSCAYYCPYPILQTNRWRPRSVKNVVDEMKYLIDYFAVKAVDFRDPVFTMSKPRAAEIAKEMLKRKIKLFWTMETRLDLLDPELIDIMYEAGLRNINVGIESSNNKVLSSARRRSDEIEHQEKIIAYCKKKGVKIEAFYIIGVGSETRKTALNTIEYAKKLNTNVAQFTISTPYPGTGFYEYMKKRGKIIEKDFTKFDIYNPVFKHQNISKKELLKLKEKAFVEYYFRPKWLLTYLPKLAKELIIQ